MPTVYNAISAFCLHDKNTSVGTFDRNRVKFSKPGKCFPEQSSSLTRTVYVKYSSAEGILLLALLLLPNVNRSIVSWSIRVQKIYSVYRMPKSFTYVFSSFDMFSNCSIQIVAVLSKNLCELSYTISRKHFTETACFNL